jgi:hypothetical protein
VPRRLRFLDSRRGLSVEIEVDAVNLTRLERETLPWFVQMRGRATIRERGHDPEVLDGFFETYLDTAGR